MKTYIITKSTFEGRIVLDYTGGIIECVKNESKMNDQQVRFLFKSLPILEEEMSAFVKNYDLVVVEQIREVHFDDFYEAFGNKVGKLKAQRAWESMSKADQLKAFMYIPKYKSIIKTKQVAMLYPATYLNQKRWED